MVYSLCHSRGTHEELVMDYLKQTELQNMNILILINREKDFKFSELQKQPKQTNQNIGIEIY